MIGQNIDMLQEIIIYAHGSRYSHLIKCGYNVAA